MPFDAELPEVEELRKIKGKREGLTRSEEATLNEIEKALREHQKFISPRDRVLERDRAILMKNKIMAHYAQWETDLKVQISTARAKFESEYVPVERQLRDTIVSKLRAKHQLGGCLLFTKDELEIAIPNALKYAGEYPPADIAILRQVVTPGSEGKLIVLNNEQLAGVRDPYIKHLILSHHETHYTFGNVYRDDTNPVKKHSLGPKIIRDLISGANDLNDVQRCAYAAYIVSEARKGSFDQTLLAALELNGNRAPYDALQKLVISKLKTPVAAADVVAVPIGDEARQSREPIGLQALEGGEPSELVEQVQTPEAAPARRLANFEIFDLKPHS